MAANDNGLIQKRQGGDHLDVYPGGQITEAGTQASSISDVATAAGDAPDDDEFDAAVGAINGILAALRGVGIIAPEA